MNLDGKTLFIIGTIAIVLCATAGCNQWPFVQPNVTTQPPNVTVVTETQSGGSSSQQTAQNCPNCGYYPWYKYTRCPNCGYGDNDGILYCPSCGVYAFHGSSWASGRCTACGYTR